jgi:hypothetical protein
MLKTAVMAVVLETIMQYGNNSIILTEKGGSVITFAYSLINIALIKKQ